MSQRRELILIPSNWVPPQYQTLMGSFTGTVTFINDKGYGFIVEDGSQSDIYLNTQQMQTPWQQRQGQIQ